MTLSQRWFWFAVGVVWGSVVSTALVMSNPFESEVPPLPQGKRIYPIHYVPVRYWDAEIVPVVDPVEEQLYVY